MHTLEPDSQSCAGLSPAKKHHQNTATSWPTPLEGDFDLPTIDIYVDGVSRILSSGADRNLAVKKNDLACKGAIVPDGVHCGNKSDNINTYATSSCRERSYRRFLRAFLQSLEPGYRRTKLSVHRMVTIAFRGFREGRLEHNRNICYENIVFT
ncbi:unnamed protein product [Lasius platythorax]|uniref:Uncharacterized protein n=1 Tax=Lasius platythorax TaxID=488582 RepID=A0AAV2P2B6_9HYME